MKRLR